MPFKAQGSDGCFSPQCHNRWHHCLTLSIGHSCHQPSPECTRCCEVGQVGSLSHFTKVKAKAQAGTRPTWPAYRWLHQIWDLAPPDLGPGSARRPGLASASPLQHPSWERAQGLAPFYRWATGPRRGVGWSPARVQHCLSRSPPPPKAPPPAPQGPPHGATYHCQGPRSTPCTPSPSRTCCRCLGSPRR